MIPKFDHPSYSLTLPSGEKIKYRPFTTKEMKNVLLVSEGGGGDVGAVKAMVELVDVCTFGKLDWLKRPFVDFEVAFVHIRARSVGDVVEMGWKCNCAGCDARNRVSADITKTTWEPFPDTTVKLSDDYAIVFEHPTVQDVLDTMDGELDGSHMLARKTRMIVSGEEVSTEFTEDELSDFYDSLPPKQKNIIDEFFQKQPVAKLVVPTKCASCGNESEIVLKGALNFFR